MKESLLPKSTARRERVVDAMAKKLADRGSVEQKIFSHRKRRLRSGKLLYVIIAVTAVSMVLTTLFTFGIIEVPPMLQKQEEVAVQVINTLDILENDLSGKVISPDQFVYYCKDYLNRYDSLPPKYQTPFSTTTSDEVYAAIAAVWDKVSLKTRQVMLRDLPALAEVQKRRAQQPPETSMVSDE